MRILFIFVKLTIDPEVLSYFATNFKNIELFCTQFNSRVYLVIHIILMFFYVERQP
jgi:hypothetical protein